MLTPEQIHKARTRAGYTQEELAAALGVDLKTVNNWEAGRTKPRSYLGALEAILGPYLDAGASAPLSSVSDAQLLAEIARRFERDRTEGKASDGTPIAKRVTAKQTRTARTRPALRHSSEPEPGPEGLSGR